MLLKYRGKRCRKTKEEREEGVKRWRKDHKEIWLTWLIQVPGAVIINPTWCLQCKHCWWLFFFFHILSEENHFNHLFSMNLYWVSQSFYINQVTWGLRGLEEGTLGVEANGGMQGTRALGWGRPVVISAGPSASVTLSRFINLWELLFPSLKSEV